MVTITLRFDRGTLLVELEATGSDPRIALASIAALSEEVRSRSGLLWDERVGHHRALAMGYREIALALHRAGVPFVDKARAFEPCTYELVKPLAPRSHQENALTAWLASGRYGTVVMPTGAGKTIFAIMAIAKAARPASFTCRLST